MSQSSQSSGQNTLNYFKLRVNFSQFEVTTIQTHLQCYIEKLQRQYFNFNPPNVTILEYHDLLEFQLIGEETSCPAFNYYHINLELIQQSYPSCLYFKARLEEDYFQCSNHIQSIYHPDVHQTIFSLNTQTGNLPTPKMTHPQTQNEVTVSSFKLTILLENFTFSVHPFDEFSRLEVKNGFFFFPLIPTSRGTACPAQQQHHFRAQPMLDPPLPPPRVMRDDTNCSIPWDHNTQSFMSSERQRLVNTVKQRLNQRRPSSAARPSQPHQSQPSHQSSQAQPRPHQQSNVNPPQSVPNLFSRGNLQPIPTSSIQVNISQPQPQPNLAHAGPPPPLAQQHVGLPQAPPAQPHVGLAQSGNLDGQAQAQPGIVLPPPPPAQTPPRFVTDVGGTTQLLSRALHDDNIPEITLNLPKTFVNQTPRNNLDQDMVWDYTNNINLTNDIRHHRPNIPPANSSTNPFATPPLASSTKYPNLPLNNFFGPNIQSLPYRVNQQNQQQHVSLPQLTVTPQPGIAGSQIGATASVNSVNTPILSSVPVVQVSNVPVTATGTRAKHVLSPSSQVPPSSSMPSSSPVPIPPPLPPKDLIQTRSLTGNSKPNANFMKNVYKKVTDKQNGGKNSRSISK